MTTEPRHYVTECKFDAAVSQMFATVASTAVGEEQSMPMVVGPLVTPLDPMAAGKVGTLFAKLVREHLATTYSTCRLVSPCLAKMVDGLKTCHTFWGVVLHVCESLPTALFPRYGALLVFALRKHYADWNGDARTYFPMGSKYSVWLQVRCGLECQRRVSGEHVRRNLSMLSRRLAMVLNQGLEPSVKHA